MTLQGLTNFIKKHKLLFCIFVAVVIFITTIGIFFAPKKFTQFNDMEAIKDVYITTNQYELATKNTYYCENIVPICSIDRLNEIFNFGFVKYHNSLRYGTLITSICGDSTNSILFDLFNDCQDYIHLEINYTNGSQKEIYVFNGYGILFREKTDENKYLDYYYDMGSTNNRNEFISCDLYNYLLSVTTLKKTEFVKSETIDKLTQPPFTSKFTN